MFQAFLDKTFQLRFSVPPLLLSDWRRFLQDALKQALPNHQEADFHGVYRAFAAKGVLEASAHTPRDLKIFVNQVGALHRVWQDKFPLSHLACYALLQKDNEDVQSTLLSNQDSVFPKRIIGDEWRGIIAALHFGVPVEEARQLLLRDPIQAALADGDGKTLSDLESVHHDGFWSVLEDIVSAWANDWNSLAPAEIARAATALETSQVLDVSRTVRPRLLQLLSNIRTAAASVRAWTPFDSETANGMVAVAKIGRRLGRDGLGTSRRSVKRARRGLRDLRGRTARRRSLSQRMDVFCLHPPQRPNRAPVRQTDGTSR